MVQLTHEDAALALCALREAAEMAQDAARDIRGWEGYDEQEAVEMEAEAERYAEAALRIEEALKGANTVDVRATLKASLQEKEATDGTH